LHSRTVNVHGDVKAVYGPVEDWADRLAMTPGGRPGPETVWIACEQLGVTESPAGRLQNPPVRLVELEAQGRVQIEGQDPKGSNFSAIGSLAKYDQSKGMFILEGNPATIDVQQLPGAPRSPYSAEKMTYWQETGRVQVHRAHAGQINVINTGAK
jgi:lipopolysaccharide export system protein LptA